MTQQKAFEILMERRTLEWAAMPREQQRDVYIRWRRRCDRGISSSWAFVIAVAEVVERQ